MRRIIASLAMMLTLGLIMAQPANANSFVEAKSVHTQDRSEIESILEEAQGSVTPELFTEGMKAIDESSIPRAIKVIGNETHTTYEAPGGYSFTVAKPNLVLSTPPKLGPVTYEPNLSGGADSIGVYVYLNQFDQDAVISGGAFALGVAICAIPAIGWAACVGVGAAMTAAGLYLSYNGKCTNNRQLKVYIFVPERNRCV